MRKDQSVFEKPGQRHTERLREPAQNADVRVATLQELADRFPGRSFRVSHPVAELLLGQTGRFESLADGLHHWIFVAGFGHG